MLVDPFDFEAECDAEVFFVAEENIDEPNKFAIDCASFFRATLSTTASVSISSSTSTCAIAAVATSLLIPLR